jgi:cellulose synthase/poly-beta-1,6-N-acetylglucosamine synthase-like glycosyltransferase
MLLQLVLFFTLASAGLTLLAVQGDLVRARAWVGLPLAAAAIALAAYAVAWLTRDQAAWPILTLSGLAAAILVRLGLRRWSMLAAALLACVLLGSLAYLAYAALLPFYDRLGLPAIAGSFLLLVLEAFALALSVYYLFEILDVFGRRDRLQHRLDPGFEPMVALQVPAYSEPVEMMRQTLSALARIEYPRLLVQVVDNNTRDPALWRPLQQLCAELGPRFQFIHLDPWPGFKAGALNEATRRLPPEVEVIGIVDADYVVKPGFLKATVGHFADPRVAFVQTPQHYRDWRDDRYLRALFYSYRYFFDVTMPARAHRNAIIFAGTMGLIRRSALEEVGGWNEEVVTEDAEASLRLLGRGYKGVYEPEVWGVGMMPLSFDGLKKQRFRWALGGIQILRRWWRELLPLGSHRLRLTFGQRLHYLFGSLHWFGDVLTALFTVLLVLTAAAAVSGRRLPVRELTGAVVVVPLLFLLAGLMRALWAMRRAERCPRPDALRAMAVWFSLSWVDALAAVRGLLSRRAAFLRTPKRREGEGGLLAALRSSSMESLLAAAALAAALAMVVRAPSIATGVLALMLLFEAAVFASAPWASLAAEGIQITPERRVYLTSPQATGDRPQAREHVWAAPLAMVATLLVILGFTVLAAPKAGPEPAQPALPGIGSALGQQPALPLPSIVPTPAPSPSASASPSASPTPSASPSPTR